MKVVRVENYAEMTEVLLKIFTEQIQNKPDSVLSFTTGKTPEKFLDGLAQKINQGLDVSNCVFLNLDEYVGRRDQPYSVYSFMQEHLYQKIDKKPREIHMMNAQAADFNAELERYAEVLKKHPRDIQLLGLGTNGHIGANEPGTPFDSSLFVAKSEESTREATRSFYGLSREETPSMMYTMGFQEIMEADHVILAASGISKAEAVKAVIEGKITEQVPASFLRTHKNFTFIIDKDAASLLEEKKWSFVSTWRMSEEGIREGIYTLQRGGNIQQAAVNAVKIVENDERFTSVGYGGLPNREGKTELDAAFMDGDMLQAGGVMAVSRIKNPIEAAFLLSGYKRNCFLAGKGAEQFAKSKGLDLEDRTSPSAKRAYEHASFSPEELENQEAYSGHDTVCVIGRDDAGKMVCAVSTSGLFLKHPGRVGDSPMIGSGFYADSDIGAAAATGVGEEIMRGCLSFAVTEFMRQGLPVQKACEAALERHKRKIERMGKESASMSVIAMDAEGNIGAATNLPVFPFVAGKTDGELRIMAAVPENGRMKIFEPEKEWWKQYEGD